MGLRVQLFGSFQLWCDEQPILAEAWRGHKAQALLKILLTEPGHTFTQDQLIDWLWPEVDPDKARHSLQDLVSRVRHILEPELERGAQSHYILTHPPGDCFNSKADCVIDAQLFEGHLNHARQLESGNQFEQAIQAYEQAVALYQGEFLAEDRYEDWAIPHTERWQRTHLDALSQLAECRTRLGQYRRAIAHCHQILEIEPYREGTYQQLMLYHCLAGDPDQAIRIYERFRTLMRQELDVEPLPETQRLYGQIVDREVPGIDEVYQPVSVIERNPIPTLLKRVPFVSREREYAQLVTHLERAKNGSGGMALVSGEAGIGKTRLIEELIHYGQYEYQVQVLAGHCHELNVSLSYQPLIDAIREKLPRLDLDTIDIDPLWSAEVADLIPELRNLIPDLPEPPSLPPELKRNRLFEGTTQLLIGLAHVQPQTHRPLILFLDDLHWVDPSTSDWLNYLLPRIHNEPILIIGAFRSEEVAGGEHPLVHLMQEGERQALLHRIELPRLSYEAVCQLLDEMSVALSEPFHERIYQETNGNPFFIVAVLQNLFAEGALRLTETQEWVSDIDDISSDYRELMIPKQIKDVIRRRVTQLKERELQVLQLAAVIGKRFEFELLQRAQGGETSELLTALEGSIQAQLLVEQADDGEYAFSHDKVWEVVYYDETGGARRKWLHRQVGKALERIYADRLEEYYGRIAEHYYRGESWEKALNYLLQAGQRAVQRSAHMEAIDHLTKGLEVLDKLPEAPERAQPELMLQTVLGTALIATKGHAAPEVEETFGRARELCQQVGETAELWPVLLGLWAFYLMRAELQTALELGEQLLHLAQREQDSVLPVNTHRTLGVALFHQGELASAQEHLEQGIALYNPKDHRTYALYGSGDPEVVCLTYDGHSLWSLGYPDQALNRSHEAIALAEELTHLYSLGWALSHAALLHQFRREAQAVQQRAEAAIALSTEHGFSFPLAIGTILRGWALAEQGQGDEGIAQLQQGLTTWRAIGSELGRPYALSLLAEAYGEVEQSEEGLTVLAEALDLVNKTGEQFYKAELYRLKGEFLLMQGEVEAEAEACFRRAIDIARRQRAKSWELRAVMSLSRLWQQQGKEEEARQMLAEIYNWFTKGFDTADLREAKALLEELS
ncbi:MAG: BTAD domain-containing putative transcriptional regulator [Candidatus Bipolaricaulia bacterium]